MTAVTIHSAFRAQEEKICHCFHLFPFCLPWSDGADAMISVFLILSFKPAFSCSSFTLLKRLFSSSSLSAIRVVLSAYLRLLIFLLAILIPACASSNPAFHMMYSAYKLNKQGDNIQPWCTPCPVWNQSVFPCLVLTVAPWPAYRFLSRQVRWSGRPISLEFSTVCCDLHSHRTRDQIANILWIIEKAREFQKNIYICFIDYTKSFDCRSQQTGKFIEVWLTNKVVNI